MDLLLLFSQLGLDVLLGHLKVVYDFLPGWYVWGSLFVSYMTWVAYLAIMNLKRAKKKLTMKVKILSIPLVVVGYSFDVFMNVFVMSFLLLELPKEKTVTDRLNRHMVDSVGTWRYPVCQWFEDVLDEFDPSGNHIGPDPVQPVG